jgi:hypothetical protein
MECKILANLRYQVAGVTTCTFLPRVLTAAKAKQQQQQLTYYLSELCLPDYSSIKFRASMIAAAALNLARQTLRKPLQLCPQEIWVSVNSVAHLCSFSLTLAVSHAIFSTFFLILSIIRPF